MVIQNNNFFAGVYVAIVAAGTGSRFGGNMPKQFLPLGGKPVLMHTIDAFRNALPGCHITLMLSPDGMNIWHDLCREYNFVSPETVEGGNSRSETVGNALKAIAKAGAKPQSTIMIHDGARPLVSAKLLHALHNAVAVDGYTIVAPGFMPTDSMEHIVDGDIVPVDRKDFMCVQTPQTFRAQTLFDAFNAAAKDTAVYDTTDDVTVVKRYVGGSVNIVPGDRNNIKITHPSDIFVAEVLLKHPYPY